MGIKNQIKSVVIFCLILFTSFASAEDLLITGDTENCYWNASLTCAIDKVQLVRSDVLSNGTIINFEYFYTTIGNGSVPHSAFYVASNGTKLHLANVSYAASNFVAMPDIIGDKAFYSTAGIIKQIDRTLLSIGTLCSGDLDNPTSMYLDKNRSLVYAYGSSTFPGPTVALSHIACYTNTTVYSTGAAGGSGIDPKVSLNSHGIDDFYHGQAGATVVYNNGSALNITGVTGGSDTNPQLMHSNENFDFAYSLAWNSDTDGNVEIYYVNQSGTNTRLTTTAADETLQSRYQNTTYGLTYLVYLNSSDSNYYVDYICPYDEEVVLGEVGSCELECTDGTLPGFCSTVTPGSFCDQTGTLYSDPFTCPQEVGTPQYSELQLEIKDTAVCYDSGMDLFGFQITPSLCQSGTATCAGCSNDIGELTAALFAGGAGSLDLLKAKYIYDGKIIGSTLNPSCNITRSTPSPSVGGDTGTYSLSNVPMVLFDPEVCNNADIQQNDTLLDNCLENIGLNTSFFTDAEIGARAFFEEVIFGIALVEPGWHNGPVWFLPALGWNGWSSYTNTSSLLCLSPPCFCGDLTDPQCNTVRAAVTCTSDLSDSNVTGYIDVANTYGNESTIRTEIRVGDQSFSKDYNDVIPGNVGPVKFFVQVTYKNDVQQTQTGKDLRCYLADADGLNITGPQELSLIGVTRSLGNNIYQKDFARNFDQVLSPTLGNGTYDVRCIGDRYTSFFKRDSFSVNNTCSGGVKPTTLGSPQSEFQFDNYTAGYCGNETIPTMRLYYRELNDNYKWVTVENGECSGSVFGADPNVPIYSTPSVGPSAGGFYELAFLGTSGSVALSENNYTVTYSCGPSTSYTLQNEDICLNTQTGEINLSIRPSACLGTSQSCGCDAPCDICEQQTFTCDNCDVVSLSKDCVGGMTCESISQESLLRECDSKGKSAFKMKVTGQFDKTACLNALDFENIRVQLTRFGQPQTVQQIGGECTLKVIEKLDNDHTGDIYGEYRLIPAIGHTEMKVDYLNSNPSLRQLPCSTQYIAKVECALGITEDVVDTFNCGDNANITTGTRFLTETFNFKVGSQVSCTDGTQQLTCVSDRTGDEKDRPLFCSEGNTLINNSIKCGCPTYGSISNRTNLNYSGGVEYYCSGRERFDFGALIGLGWMSLSLLLIIIIFGPLILHWYRSRSIAKSGRTNE